MINRISVVLLFLVSLLDHPLLEEIVGLPPLSLQFIWSVEDSEATLPPPPPTLYMSSSSLSIRSVTEYRFWFNSCCRASPDGEFAVIIAAVVVVVVVNTCTNRHNLYYYYYYHYLILLSEYYKRTGKLSFTLWMCLFRVHK